MTGTELATEIRRKTKTNSTTFTDAVMLPIVNWAKDELASAIQIVRRDVWKMPFLDDSVKDQREYAFPADVMNNIDYVEIKFTSSGDYVQAVPMSRHHYKDVLQETIIVRDFDNDNPRYFTRRKAIYFLSGSIIAVTDAIRVVSQIFPANLANVTGSTDLSVDPSTTTHGFPREFHELWTRRVSIEYKDSNNIKLSTKENNFDRDLDKAIGEFQIAISDKEIVGALPSAASRSNDGYNL